MTDNKCPCYLCSGADDCRVMIYEEVLDEIASDEILSEENYTSDYKELYERKKRAKQVLGRNEK